MSVAPQNSGQIVANTGKWSAQTCNTENDLINNQALEPLYRKKLERRNGRYLMTYLTSGALSPMGFNLNVDTKVPYADGMKVKEAPGIGSTSYRYNVLGRIERKAVVVSQVGASGVDGSFTLKMQDTHLYKNQVVRLGGSGLRAITLSQASGSSASGFLYNFKTLTGATFVYATDIGAQKSCFPEYTAYSEGSLTSDSRNKAPDTLIGFMTTQRKTIEITGSAQSDVIRYTFADGLDMGWLWWVVKEGQTQMAMENERQKKFGVSTMKNTDGTLKATSDIIDPATGKPIVAGDGLEEQISSSNVFIGTGVNGEFTLDDFTNAMSTMKKGSNQAMGIIWVGITGTDGFVNAQQQMVNLAGNQNVQIMQSATQGDQAGGTPQHMGFTFTRLNFAGDSMWFVLDPMFDDVDYFPEVGLDGKSLMSSSYLFIGISTTDEPTMEIIAKEANGLNRAHVEARYEGLTGAKGGTTLSEYDGTKIAMLKEDGLFVYNPTLCAVGYKLT